MITCAQAVRQLWEYLERDIEEAERERVEEHLAFCRRCCGEVEFAEALRGVLRSAAAPQLPPDVEGRFTDFLEELEEGQDDQGPDVQGRDPRARR